jgi:hypothetical protein
MKPPVVGRDGRGTRILEDWCLARYKIQDSRAFQINNLTMREVKPSPTYILEQGGSPVMFPGYTYEITQISSSSTGNDETTRCGERRQRKFVLFHKYNLET